MKNKTSITHLTRLCVWCIVSGCLFVSCVNDPTKKEIIKKDPEYNIQKDSFIISHLRTKPIFAKKEYIDFMGYIDYTIRFEDCEFRITQTLDVPYHSVGSWDYHCNMKDGKMVMLQSVYDVWEHKCSKNAYKILQDYCRAIK